MAQDPRPTFQLQPAFSVPFVLVQHPDAAAMNQQLRHLLLAREAEGATYANSKATMQIAPRLFESRFDLFKWPEGCIRELREFCWSSLYRAIGELNGYDAPMLQRLKGTADAWFHVTRHGGYFGLHNHAMASWSGVYCVDPGGDGDEGGLLNFPHPNAAGSMFIDMSTYRLRQPFGFSSRDYRLKPGQLVLFPSWLTHQVLPYMGDAERITIAFNAWFKLEDELGASPRR